MDKKDMTATVLDKLARRITVLEGKMIEMQKEKGKEYNIGDEVMIPEHDENLYAIIIKEGYTAYNDTSMRYSVMFENGSSEGRLSKCFAIVSNANRQQRKAFDKIKEIINLKEGINEM